jgi:potassium-dependent mechanosensitive channel
MFPWEAVYGWITLIASPMALELLALREPFLKKTGEVLNADLNLGSLHFTLAHILTFCITVWAAFLVSRFLRFVLEEEVYQRLQLPRGLPPMRSPRYSTTRSYSSDSSPLPLH